MTITDHIFRAYDIRGKVPDELNESVLLAIGRGFGVLCLDQLAKLSDKRQSDRSLESSTVVVGYDGRLSSQSLAAACIQGLQESGCHVISIGQVSTGTFYHCVKSLPQSHGHGLMITGSHNPPEDNGIKLLLNQLPLLPNEIQHLKRKIFDNPLKHASLSGNQISPVTTIKGKELYTGWLHQQFDPLLSQTELPKLVLDAGNGIAGPIAESVFSRYGQVTALYCDVDGAFPHHHPDPSIADNLKDLIDTIHNTTNTWGLAFDGDGDRLAIVTPNGTLLSADEIMLCFIQDLIDQHKFDHHNATPPLFLFDVKTSRRLHNMVKELGARYQTIRTGHSFLKIALKQTHACFAGELSGHFAFQDPDTGFDCGLYAGLRWLDLLQRRGMDFIEHTLLTWPKWHSTPEILVAIPEYKKLSLIEKLKQSNDFIDYQQDDTDGIIFYQADHWVLIRPSNTTANLTVRAEAKTLPLLESTLDRASHALEALLDS